ncbi:hypothetical protein [Brevundimonas diminuta]|uniref:hypothetical protein n=1 Tax=Brevundimonas diminuta TaxID=293 RepID=UPI000B356135|nr:hypothetical protein [Brevundimonas diminuta]
MLTFCVAMIGTFGLTCDTLAQVQSSERSALLSALSGCRAMPDAAARLNCFDRTADALDTAERQGDLVIMERQQIREARRQLFGFSAPALPTLFGRGGGGADTEPEVDSVETTLVSAGQDHEGKWTFRLADGGEWRQIDSAPVRFQNRNGTEVRVRRAALGSYLLTAGKSRAVRVKRQ